MLYYCISKGKDLHNPNMFYEVNAENNLQWANSNKKRCISILSKRFKKLSMRICNQFFSFIMQTITNNITQFKYNDFILSDKKKESILCCFQEANMYINIVSWLENPFLYVCVRRHLRLQNKYTESCNVVITSKTSMSKVVPFQ